MTEKRRMMSVYMVIASACVLALSLMGWAEDEAQSRPQSTARESWSDQQSHQEFTPNLVNANALIGADVKNAQDEYLGKIREVVLNSQRDKVSYVAVGLGGVLGIGEKHLAVPWSALDVQAGKEGKVDKVILNVPRQDFDDAPGFDTNNWPNQGDARWSVYAPDRGQEGSRMMGTRRDGTDSDRRRSGMEAQRDRGATYGQDERARMSDTQRSGTDTDRSRSGMETQRDRGATYDQDERARTRDTWRDGTDSDRRRLDMEAQRDRGATSGQDERARTSDAWRDGTDSDRRRLDMEAQRDRGATSGQDERARTSDTQRSGTDTDRSRSGMEAQRDRGATYDQDERARTSDTWRDGTDSDRRRLDMEAQRDRGATSGQDERARTSDTWRDGTDSDRSRSQAQRDGAATTYGQNERARTSDTWRDGTDSDRRRLDMEAQRDRGATYDQYGITAMGRGLTYRKLTEIVGLSVKNRQDEDLGNIEDVVLDLQEGRPVYGLIGFGGFLGFGERMTSIPWSAITIRQEIARIDMTKDELRNLAYEPDSGPDLTNTERAEQLHTSFGERPYWQVFGYSESSEAQGYEAWKSGSNYNKMYDASKEETVKGTLLSIGTFQPETGADGGMRLRLKTEDDKTAVICIGPREHIAKQNIVFVPGEQIEVTGSQVEINGRTIIMAREVKHDEKTLTLRSQDGQPKWSDDKDGAPDESTSPTVYPMMYQDRP